MNRTGQKIWDLLTGMIILGFGIALLMGTLDLVDARSLLSRYWPVLMILMGVRAMLLGLHNNSEFVSGLFWCATGALFFLSVHGIVGAPVRNLILPVLVIWFGVLILYRPLGCGSVERKGGESI